MKKTTRIKSSPIATTIEFVATVSELAMLETKKRAIEAQRDTELQRIYTIFDEALAPVVERIRGQMALAEAYADAHRAELLPKDAKSVKTSLATYGWRTGNRAVALLSRVTVDHAINALKALGLGGYVATKEEIARAKILADCKDDKTLTIAVSPITSREIALADAGLKITQAEAFFVDPTSETAETLKNAEAA
jgi:phage host-nuclease inhibitor protein Gam